MSRYHPFTFVPPLKPAGGARRTIISAAIAPTSSPTATKTMISAGPPEPSKIEPLLYTVGDASHGSPSHEVVGVESEVEGVGKEEIEEEFTAIYISRTEGS